MQNYFLCNNYLILTSLTQNHSAKSFYHLFYINWRVDVSSAKKLMRKIFGFCFHSALGWNLQKNATNVNQNSQRRAILLLNVA